MNAKPRRAAPVELAPLPPAPAIVAEYADNRCAARRASDRYQPAAARLLMQRAGRAFGNPDRSTYAALDRVKAVLDRDLALTDATFVLHRAGLSRPKAAPTPAA